MTTNTEYSAPPPLPPAPRPPLRRSQSDKVIAGVAGGFARWLGIDPVIVRVVLVVLAVFGGPGILLYGIGWAFIPLEGSERSSADDFLAKSKQSGSSARTWLIVIGVVVGVIVLLSLISSVFGGWGGGSVLLLCAVGGLVLYLVNRDPSGVAAIAPAAFAYGDSGQYPGYLAPLPTPVPPTPPRAPSYLGLVTLSIAVIVTGVLASLEATGVFDPAPVVIPAVGLAILGVGVLVGAWAGRARWLLWFAVPMLFVTLIASFVPTNIPANLTNTIEAGIGEMSWSPTTVDEASRAHTLGIGSARLDLSGLVVPAGVTIVPVGASVTLGELVVIVPADARVLLDARVNTGELAIAGLPRQNDPSPSFDGVLPGGSATGPVIELTLLTNVGSLEVSRA
jgi:phage shock protein PspC (stress-responsive transcriptional regulator)